MKSLAAISGWLTFTLLLFFLTPAVAKEMDRYSLTPFAGYYGFEGNKYYDDSGIAGAALGYALDENWTIEGSYGFLTPTSKMEGTSADGHLLRAEILYNFDFWENFVPFVAAGGGGIFLFSNDYDRSSAIFSYGAGAKYYFSDNWALRGDIRHILADNQHPTNQMLVTLGLSYFFGGPDTHQAATTSVPSAATAPQKEEFSPAPQKEEEIIFTPAEKNTSQQSAPLAPPSTLQPVTVCVEIDVKFDFDKSNIKPQFSPELEQFAKFIKTHSDTPPVIINGHTDSTGPVQYNIGLSKRRAASVRDALVEQYGLDAGKLSIQWFGPKDPVAPNTTRSGRAQNRRATAGVCVEQK